jgi:hypothetical protein
VPQLLEVRLDAVDRFEEFFRGNLAGVSLVLAGWGVMPVMPWFL